MKKNIYFFLYVIFSGLLMLEAILYVMPVAELFNRKKVVATTDLLSYEPYQKITYSLGVNFYRVLQKQTNDLGFVADYDFSQIKNPSFVVIGDSFVEALQVNFSESITGQLNSKLMEPIPSLAVSGAALSQYAAFAQEAKKLFNPEHYVFVIVGNDYDESVCALKSNPGHRCFNQNGDLELIPFEGFSLFKTIARQSNLIRYMVLNGHLDPRKIFLKSEFFAPEITDHEKNANNQFRYKASAEAINYFFNKLKKLVDGRPVTFIVDGDREFLYGDRIAKTDAQVFSSAMRDFFIANALRNEFKVIDMDNIFRKDFELNRVKFEFPTDAHWNEKGHSLAAEALISSLSKGW